MKLTESTWKIKESMAKIKINSVTELGKRIGLTRPTASRKVNCPSLFTVYEIQSLARLFGWSDEELGAFVRGLK